MPADRTVTAAAVPARSAARLTPVARPSTLPIPTAAPVPLNKLEAAERARILAAVNPVGFVDLPPIQIYAVRLELPGHQGDILWLLPDDRY
jgi:putative transposase